MLLHDFAILLSCQRTRPRSCGGSEWRQSGHKRRWSCLGWVHASWSWQEENENSQRTTCVQFVCSLPSFAICLVVKNQRHPKTTAATDSTWFYLEQTSESRAVNKLHVHVIYRTPNSNAPACQSWLWWVVQAYHFRSANKSSPHVIPSDIIYNIHNIYIYYSYESYSFTWFIHSLCVKMTPQCHSSQMVDQAFTLSCKPKSFPCASNFALWTSMHRIWDWTILSLELCTLQVWKNCET